MNINLRPWQEECIRKGTAYLTSASHRCFFINAAPGSGKTLCASALADELIAHGSVERVIVIAPTRSVVQQWARDFRRATGREMVQITGADEEPEGYGVDICATWPAVQGTLEGMQAICRRYRTLVICDEHHHAAVAAAWGDGADRAFADAQHMLVLSGTPVRSDGKQAVWLAHDQDGQLDHPEEGLYTLSYGEAVDLEYCRPVTFHRQDARARVYFADGTSVEVCGTEKTELDPSIQRLPGIEQALAFSRLITVPTYLPNGDPDPGSFQASMLNAGIQALHDIRARLPEAGGLVIAPSIQMAEYMARLLETLDGERPVLVHTQTGNPASKISAFRNNRKRWIVSVGMISEGVDIPRLRVLVYLPNALTETAFRQAIGRVVRSAGPNDDSRAYVVMPALRILEEHARRIEREMPANKRRDELPTHRVCPECRAEAPRDAPECPVCEAEFPRRGPRLRSCPACDALNLHSADSCHDCGEQLRAEFRIDFEDALRVGIITRGMDLTEEEVQLGEAMREPLRRNVLRSGDEQLIKLLRLLPDESYARLAGLFDRTQT